MQVFLTAAFNLFVQLFLAAGFAWGAAALARGAWRERLLDAWRALRLVAVAAAIGAALAAVPALAGYPAAVWEPVPMLFPGLATIVGAFGTGGIVLTVAAGDPERRGRLDEARQRVGFGGRVAFLGAATQVVLWATTFLAQPGARQKELVSAGALAGQAGLGAMLLGTAGFTALLAALTGKPRPSGAAAAILYATAYTVLVGAALALVN